MINKWMAKIKGNEAYNIRGPPGMGIEKKEKLKEDDCCSCHPRKLLQLSIEEPRRRLNPRIKSEDKLSPFLHAFSHPTSIRSCPAAEESLTKTQFLSPFLYQIHCIGPVGFGFIHIYSEGPPQSGPYSRFKLKLIIFYQL